MISRRFYRLVSAKDPPLRDFRSLIGSGHPPYDDPELQRRAEEVSIWDNIAAMFRLRQKMPHLPYAAVIEIPESVELTRGKRGHWGIPKGIRADQIKRWVIGVIEVPWPSTER